MWNMGQNSAFSARVEQEGTVEVVRLADAARQMEVRIAPSIGNLAYAFTVNGKNALWFPFSGLEELRAKPALCGIPFLAPWANRLDGDSYWVNGKRYQLNSALGNLRRDGHQKPIHGLLLFSSAWALTATGADAHSAYATSRLEFWRHPELMAQFPFAHNLTVTYRLENGSLAVETRIDNHSREALPVAIGYHPYFQLHDAPRDQWTVHLAARERLLLDEFLIPTGAREPLPFADPHPLRTRPLDDVFGGLMRDETGVARFWVTGQREKIEVAYGPQYGVAVVYAPEGQGFLCFEPMAAITNAFNLAQAGVYRELPSVAPEGQWSESFWVTPSGF